jgi:uncharacterized membrane protein
MDPCSALLVVFFGAFPSFEARYAIPFAMVLGFPPGWAFFFGIIGNLLPIIPLLLLLGPVSDWLRNRSTIMERFFTWVFERTRKNKASIARYGVYALFLFVAIPLPGTGVWTGAAMAFVFNIDWKTAFVAISAGAVVAALITTLPTLGLLNLFEELS